MKQKKVKHMYSESFSNRLKKARINAGFTQEQTALETGIPRSTIANYERGRTQPDIENIGILANFYQTSTDWLISLPDLPYPTR